MLLVRQSDPCLHCLIFSSEAYDLWLMHSLVIVTMVVTRTHRFL
jgi:hypothetical protein